MNENEPTSREMHDLFPLDAADGPAAPLDDLQTSELIEGALDAWQADLPPSPETCMLCQYPNRDCMVLTLAVLLLEHLRGS